MTDFPTPGAPVRAMNCVPCIKRIIPASRLRCALSGVRRSGSVGCKERGCLIGETEGPPSSWSRSCPPTGSRPLSRPYLCESIQESSDGNFGAILWSDDRQPPLAKAAGCTPQRRCGWRHEKNNRPRRRTGAAKWKCHHGSYGTETPICRNERRKRLAGSQGAPTEPRWRQRALGRPRTAWRGQKRAALACEGEGDQFGEVCRQPSVGWLRSSPYSRALRVVIGPRKALKMTLNGALAAFLVRPPPSEAARRSG